jgi:hypothetical protein
MATKPQKKSAWSQVKDYFSKAEEQVEEVVDDLGLGYDGVTVSMLLGSGKRQARARATIYEKWHFMAGDPFVSAALRLLVTQALGGHETTGDTVFIEVNPNVQGDKAAEKLAQEIQKDLAPIFNRIAHQIAFNGAAFGDAYGRIYARDKVGVTDIYIDEMVYSPLVQPYEQGNKTVGFIVTSGTKNNERLTVKQLARLKMPRMLYVPQIRALDKAYKVALKEDDPDKLPILPALAGGSFLDAAEEAFDDLMTSMQGLVGSRIRDSIEEYMVSIQQDGMTEQQRKEYKTSLTKMLKDSKDRAAKAIEEKRPILQRFYHLIPTFREKQITQIAGFNQGSTAQSFTIDDIMMHARRLAGALGCDLSMLGFADQLSGGLGDGGFFRVSAQSAERARIIRTALNDLFHSVVDVHTFHKYGFVFAPGERPYQINFYGSISALETEQQHTRETAMNTGLALIGGLSQLRDLGINAEAVTHILSKVMKMDEDAAKLIAKALETAKPPGQDDGMGGGFGGGFGGNEPAQVPEDQGDELPEEQEE